jgi:hypothetical protein
MATARGTGGDGPGLMDHAKDTARAKLGEQQRVAASGIGDFARSLRQAAGQSGGDGTGEGSTLAARAAHGVADRLERLSGTLRDEDLDSVVRQAESFARREPLLFFGAAVAAGFVALRLLKSAAPSRDEISRRM